MALSKRLTNYDYVSAETIDKLINRELGSPQARARYDTLSTAFAQFRDQTDEAEAHYYAQPPSTDARQMRDETKASADRAAQAAAFDIFGDVGMWSEYVATTNTLFSIVLAADDAMRTAHLEPGFVHAHNDGLNVRLDGFVETTEGRLSGHAVITGMHTRTWDVLNQIEAAEYLEVSDEQAPYPLGKWMRENAALEAPALQNETLRLNVDVKDGALDVSLQLLNSARAVMADTHEPADWHAIELYLPRDQWPAEIPGIEGDATPRTVDPAITAFLEDKRAELPTPEPSDVTARLEAAQRAVEKARADWEAVDPVIHDSDVSTHEVEYIDQMIDWARGEAEQPPRGQSFKALQASPWEPQVVGAYGGIQFSYAEGDATLQERGQQRSEMIAQLQAVQDDINTQMGARGALNAAERELMAAQSAAVDAAAQTVPDPITIYSKPGCVQCKATERQMDKYGIDYQVVDLTQDPAAMEYVVSLGFQQAPVVDAHTPDIPPFAGYRPDTIAKISETTKERIQRNQLASFPNAGDAARPSTPHKAHSPAPTQKKPERGKTL